MLIHPDRNWTIYEDFKADWSDWIGKHMPFLELRNEVPTPVKESFDVVRKLIEHSYYECRFYEVATLKAMLTFEMALKHRFRELNPETKIPPTLYALIKWFESNYYFEVYNNFYLDAIRQVRNAHAHPESEGYSGSLSKDFIGRVVDLVNGLYEDPVLRKLRIAQMKAAGALLENICSGLVVTRHGHERLCFRAWVSFIDNKANPNAIHFYYCPCDSISQDSYRANNWSITTATYIMAQSIVIRQDEVTLQLGHSEYVTVRPINSQIHQTTYDKWVYDFPDLQQAAGSVVLNGDQLINTFEMHLRLFHRS